MLVDPSAVYRAGRPAAAARDAPEGWQRFIELGDGYFQIRQFACDVARGAADKAAHTFWINEARPGGGAASAKANVRWMTKHDDARGPVLAWCVGDEAEAPPLLVPIRVDFAGAELRSRCARSLRCVTTDIAEGAELITQYNGADFARGAAEDARVRGASRASPRATEASVFAQLAAGGGAVDAPPWIAAAPRLKPPTPPPAPAVDATGEGAAPKKKRSSGARKPKAAVPKPSQLVAPAAAPQPKRALDDSGARGSAATAKRKRVFKLPSAAALARDATESGLLAPPVGTVVVTKFGQKWWRGRVMWSSDARARVVYDDEEEEQITFPDRNVRIVAPATARPPEDAAPSEPAAVVPSPVVHREAQQHSDDDNDSSGDELIIAIRHVHESPATAGTATGP